MDAIEATRSEKFPRAINEKEKDLSELLSRVLNAPLQPIHKNLDTIDKISKTTETKLDNISTDFESIGLKIKKIEKNIAEELEWLEKFEGILHARFRHHEQFESKHNEEMSAIHAIIQRIIAEMSTATQVADNANVSEKRDRILLEVCSDLKSEAQKIAQETRKREILIIWLVATAIIFICADIIRHTV